MIRSVKELTFFPDPNVTECHSVFYVTMMDNQRWVVDITGIQFGIDWPLLVPASRYIAERIGFPMPRTAVFYQLGFISTLDALLQREEQSSLPERLYSGTFEVWNSAQVWLDNTSGQYYYVRYLAPSL